MANRMFSGNFDLNDMLLQIRQMKKMGSITGIMKFLPGMGRVQEAIKNSGLKDDTFKYQEAIILSMTKKERTNPEIIFASRKKRIANGSGTTISEVEKLEATGDEQTGINIIKKALEAPVRQIAENAGLESSVIVAKLKEVEVGYGFNAATEEWVDMIKAGIVDPTKVTRSALQNAASVSSLFLSTEAVVADVSKDEPIQPQMPMM